MEICNLRVQFIRAPAPFCKQKLMMIRVFRDVILSRLLQVCKTTQLHIPENSILGIN
jgi:hypothetical protein